MDALFAPPEHEWRRLSPNYPRLLLVGAAVPLLLAVVAAVFLGWLTEPWIGALAIVPGLLLAAWLAWRAGRYARSWGYAELGDELFITRGLWFKQLTIVPYGRMQVVEVESGPIERSFKLATVKLVTASASTDATIPGLSPTDAAALRDRLIRRGEARASGL